VRPGAPQKGAPGAQNEAYLQKLKRENDRRVAPAIDSTKNSSLFEVPLKDTILALIAFKNDKMSPQPATLPQVVE
jgi:hypothetical protein